MFDDIKPGTSFDITIPTWRLGEAILEVSYIAERLDANGDLICRCRWTGIADRSLVSRGNRNRLIPAGYSATQDSYEATKGIAISALPDLLPELVFALLEPLYELFDFFKLPKRLVEQESVALRNSRF